MQASSRIAAKMACRCVFGRIKEFVGRNCKEQVTGRFQNRMDKIQCSSFVFNVFQDIEKADRPSATGGQLDVFQPRADYRVNSTRAGGQGAVNAGLDQNAMNTGRDKSL